MLSAFRRVFELDSNLPCNKPLLVVLSGPSGVGKDTVLQKMREMQIPMHYAITATTRPKRPGEIDGYHYYFLSVEDFKKKIEQGEFLEYANVYGNWYGSPKSPVIRALKEGKDVLLKLDVQGARSVRKDFPEALLLFLAPPSIEWLKYHLRARKTETPEKLRAREEAALEELKAADEFDYVVLNRDNDVESVVREIVEIINREKSSRCLGRPQESSVSR